MTKAQERWICEHTVDAMAWIREELAKDHELAAAVAEERRKVAIADAIREAREAAGLTQAQLAEKAGMHQPAIARLENTNYERISYRTLSRIADALGLVLEIRLSKPEEATAPKRSSKSKSRKGITAQH